MSRYPTPREFDPRKPLEVRIWFRYAGHDYSPGEPFNWRQKGINMRRVRQMYDAGKLQQSKKDPVSVVDETADPGPDLSDVAENDPVSASVETFDFDFSDGLDEIYNLGDLKDIARMEGAPTKRSIKEQRDAIRENRAQNG